MFFSLFLMIIAIDIFNYVCYNEEIDSFIFYSSFPV